jgi:NAD(P)-dependent dehydrogenase (short-subunit alcohol dehydrogenase family)
VNVGSIAGLVGPPYSGMYAASKHALEALSEALHFELAQQGVRVRVVEPGQFATALADNSIYAAAMNPETAEWGRFQRYRVAQATLKPDPDSSPPAGTGEAQAVADVIYQAAVEEPGRLRYLVGADAELIAATKAAMSFEDFDTTMRAALNWHE